MNRRVFYFSGYRMKVFEWHHHELVGSCSFEPTEEGFQEFGFYLKHASAIPGQLLVDLVEEDFRREQIPHVTGKDHKVLITRLIDRHYRGEPFIHIEKLGREKQGRKDDRVLLSALTNQILLKPWLDIFNQCESPLAGIWSVPLISKQILPLIARNDKNVLLLSRLILTAQRETYFKDGELMLSRQAKLDRDNRELESALGTPESLTFGVQQIHIFLTNQRIMAFNDVLNVYCIVPGDFMPSLKAKTLDTEKIKYHYVDLESLFKHFKIKQHDHYHADVLYSFLCAKKSLLTDHYATKKEKLFFYRYLISKSVRVGAMIGSLLILIGSGLLFLNAKELNQKRLSMEANRELLVRRFQQDFVPLEQPLADSIKIQTSVDLAKKLTIETANSPENYFAYFSPVFSQDYFSDIHLEALHWKKYTAQELAQYLVTQEASVAEEKASDAYAEPYVEVPPSDYMQVLVTLSGHLDRNGRDYREVYRMMNSFIFELNKVPGVTKLVVLKMPVDVRPGRSFSDEKNAEKILQSKDQEKIENEYEILIGMDIHSPDDQLKAEVVYE